MKKILYRIGLLISATSLLIVSGFLTGEAFATGTLTASSVIELGTTANANPMIVSDPQAVAVAFTTSAAGAITSGYTVTLTFGFGVTLWTQTSTPTSSSGVLSTTAPTVLTSYNSINCTALTGASTDLPGTLATPVVTQASGTIAVTSSGASDSLSNSTSYCFYLSNGTSSIVTNPTGTAQYPVNIATSQSATAYDNQTDMIDVLSSGANAYNVTATVAPSFSMSEGTNSDAFGTLAVGSVNHTTSGVQWTINTNANSGWFVWAADQYGGLHSASAGSTIGTVATTSNVNFTTGDAGNQYGLAVTSTAGNASSTYSTADYTYGGSGTGGSFGAGLLSSLNGYQEIASSSTTATNAQFKTYELASIAGSQPPGTDYTDTVTLIGAGRF